MQITETKVKVSDLCKNYSDNGDGGVYGYDGKLTIRPSFQREFIYRDNAYYDEDNGNWYCRECWENRDD